MTYRKSNQKYIDKIYEHLNIRVRRGRLDIYKKLAEMRGQSLAGMVTGVLDQMAVEAGLMDPEMIKKESTEED